MILTEQERKDLETVVRELDLTISPWERMEKETGDSAGCAPIRAALSRLTAAMEQNTSAPQSVSDEAREIIQHLIYALGENGYGPEECDGCARARAFLARTKKEGTERPEGVPEFVYAYPTTFGTLHTELADVSGIERYRYRFDGIVKEEGGE